MLSRKPSPKLLLECITPQCYLSSLSSNILQLASKTCRLLLYGGQCNQQQRPQWYNFLWNLWVCNLLMNCIQGDRMKVKVQSYQLRLFNSSSPTHNETIIYVSLPTKTVLLFCLIADITACQSPSRLLREIPQTLLIKLVSPFFRF